MCSRPRSHPCHMATATDPPAPLAQRQRMHPAHLHAPAQHAQTVIGMRRACRWDAVAACMHALQRRYGFNIVFNLINKSTLNAFPCPWFIGTWQLSKLDFDRENTAWVAGCRARGGGVAEMRTGRWAQRAAWCSPAST